ncbi:MAG: response regulator transcription factor [Panacagrimonas sp.]
MSAHVFVVPQVQGRWHEAFDDVVLATDAADAIRQARSGSLLWIDVAQREWIATLVSARPDLVLIALSLNPSVEEGSWAFQAGVRGYCHTLAVPEMLRQVALVVSNGGLWLGAELMARTAAAVARMAVPDGPADASPLENLTARERDVAQQVLGGASNKEIARRLDITPRTVKAHMGAMFEKLGVRDRLQLVLALRRAGIPVSPDA